MRLTSAAIRKLLPLWSKYKAWAQDVDTFQAGGFTIAPGQRLLLKRGEKKLYSFVIGSTGKSGDETMFAVVDPGMLRVELHAVPDDDFGQRIGTKPASVVKLLPRKPTATRLGELKDVYTLLRTTDWDAVTGGYLQISDPDLFVAAYDYAVRDMRLDQVLLDNFNRAKDAYYGPGASHLRDDQFDRLQEVLGDRNVKIAAVAVKDKVGAPVKGAKATLPNVMGSLDKVKSTSEIKAWLKKIKIGDVPFVATVKKDGISLQLFYKNKVLAGAWTRGDGVEGKDVLAHVKAMPDKTVPKKVFEGNPNPLATMYVRAEAIMPVAKFDKYAKSKSNPKGFENPRNLVAGIFNRSTPDAATLADIDLLAFEIMGVSTMTKVGQLKTLKGQGFQIPEYDVFFEDVIKDDTLDVMLRAMKAKAKHDMDGLVLEVDHPHLRKSLGTERGGINPAYARAYKPDDGASALAEVISVEWNVSKFGVLKPVVLIKAVKNV